MLVRLLLMAALAWPTVVPGAVPPNEAFEVEIAKIDEVTADPARKMVALEAMAVRLGTHRNRLLLLRRQSGDSFGHIFVSQLEAKGKTPPQIEAELQAVNDQIAAQLGLPGGEQPAVGPGPWRPVLYLGTGVDHNSAGTFFTLAPEVGLESRNFTLVGGVPYFWNFGSDLASSGIGDAYVSGLVHGTAAGLDIGANLVVGFPTGDEDRGLGAGQVTVDASGLLQKRFERFRPFVKGGVANYVFDNVGYQRPYISTGNAVHFSGGVDFRAHDRVVLGGGGFAVHPWGDQNVQPRAPLRGSGEASGTPRGGQSSGVRMPFLSSEPQADVPAAELQDHGVVGWASFELSDGVTLSFSLARSFPFELTTVGFGLGLDFARLFLSGKSF
jgi:hypothetical protein